MQLDEKLKKLENIIKEAGTLAVAFSGGVDSTFLLKVAYDTLKENVLAVTARSSTYPEREFNEAVRFARDIGARHEVIVSEELDIDGFSGNPVNRCYFCKKELFIKLREAADRHHIKYIAHGANVDDLGDYRPGMIAAEELGVISPLKEAELTKEEIRILSKKMGLPTWDKPAFACLASRVPYGESITKDKLDMIGKAEQFLLDSGFRQMRVRHHGDIARIEVAPAERKRFFDEGFMDRVYEEFNRIGFKYAALDLKGYRTGSMNEGIVAQNNPGKGQ